MLSALLTAMLLTGILLVIASKFVKWDTLLFKAIAKLRAWQALHVTTNPQLGAINAGRMIDALVAVLLGVILVYQFAPMFESNAQTTNITNATTKNFGNLGSWIIPTICFIGLIVLATKQFFHWGGSKGKG